MDDKETFNIYEAKTNLSRLIQKALKGEKVFIAKSGKPLVELKKISRKKSSKRLGGLEGKVWISDDFNDSSIEIQQMFGLDKNS